MPAPKSFGRDPGLQARMLATIFLLGLVYVVLIAVLIAAGVGAVTVAVIAGALFLVQYFSSDKLALYSMGAHEVSAEQAPALHATIERLCIQANLPMPRVRRRGRGTVTRGARSRPAPSRLSSRLIGDLPEREILTAAMGLGHADDDFAAMIEPLQNAGGTEL